MFWIGLLAALVLVAVYIVIVRPMLASQPLFSEAFKAEASLKQKIQAKITGWKTKIAARLMLICSGAVAFYDSVLPIASGQDWSPIAKHLPDWSLPVGLLFVGLLFGWLRKVTENPPQIVTAKDDTGEAKVIAILPPTPAA